MYEFLGTSILASVSKHLAGHSDLIDIVWIVAVLCLCTSTIFICVPVHLVYA